MGYYKRTDPNIKDHRLRRDQLKNTCDIVQEYMTRRQQRSEGRLYREENLQDFRNYLQGQLTITRQHLSK